MKALLLLAFAAVGPAATAPADWVPARWPWNDAASLELLKGTPVNCLLVRGPSAEFVAAAGARGVATLAVVKPGEDWKKALAVKAAGVVLDGDFPEAEAAAIRSAAGQSMVIELAPRTRLKLGSGAAVIGTYEGVWPGIGEQEGGSKKAGPTGSTWIDTNTGFLRAARAWGDGAVWIANEPPANTVVTGARYLQAIADGAMSGARWVVAFDADFAARLGKREARAVADWRRMAEMLGHFERRPEWRRMREFGRLAVVQDASSGALVSGGILDMIAVKHTPVRPIPGRKLSAEALQGATMAVNVDPESLTAEQKEVLRGFTRSGNTMLSGPPGWKRTTGQGLTLEKDEVERLNDMWRDVNQMIGRRNLGVRLFNVSSMLSNAVESADGRSVVLHLVNYADFPVENVTAHFLGEYRTATLLTPDGVEKKLELYRADEAQGVDIDKVVVCATIKLEK